MFVYYNILVIIVRGCSSVVERPLRMRKVAGSIPVSSRLVWQYILFVQWYIILSFVYLFLFQDPTSFVLQTLYVSAKIEIQLFLGYKSICTYNLLPKYNFWQYHYSWQNTTINWKYVPRANEPVMYWEPYDILIIGWEMAILSAVYCHWFTTFEILFHGHDVYWHQVIFVWPQNTNISTVYENQYRFPIKQRIKTDKSLPKRVLQFYALKNASWVNLGSRQPGPTHPATMVARLDFPSPWYRFLNLNWGNSFRTHWSRGLRRQLANN